MTTGYRRGIPSVAHVEAATRLGLEWEDSDTYARAYWRILSQGGEMLTCFRFPPSTSWSRSDAGLPNPRLSFRPIRTDGTPVDWEVLDSEAARVTQPIAPTNEDARRLQFAGRQAGSAATVTPTASTAPTTQPRGFRASLYGISRAADFLTRWAVYQELKPLYDLVDGAQGEVAMPWDVAEALQAPEHANDLVVYGRDNAGRVCLHLRDGGDRTYSAMARTDSTSPTILNERLHDFAAVLDAVAEQRVAERQATMNVEVTGTNGQIKTTWGSDTRDGKVVAGSERKLTSTLSCACGERLEYAGFPSDAKHQQAGWVRLDTVWFCELACALRLGAARVRAEIESLERQKAKIDEQLDAIRSLRVKMEANGTWTFASANQR